MKLGTTNRIKDLTVEYPFDKVTPWNLTEYLFLIHQRKGLVPHFQKGAYLRGMKKLIESVGPEKAVLLILKAGETCSFPFGIEYLKKLNEVL